MMHLRSLAVHSTCCLFKMNQKLTSIRSFLSNAIIYILYIWRCFQKGFTHFGLRRVNTLCKKVWWRRGWHHRNITCKYMTLVCHCTVVHYSIIILINTSIYTLQLDSHIADILKTNRFVNTLYFSINSYSRFILWRDHFVREALTILQDMEQLQKPSSKPTLLEINYWKNIRCLQW